LLLFLADCSVGLRASGVTTDSADPAMPVDLWGPKIVALVFH